MSCQHKNIRPFLESFLTSGTSLSYAAVFGFHH